MAGLVRDRSEMFLAVLDDSAVGGTHVVHIEVPVAIDVVVNVFEAAGSATGSD